MGDLLEITTLGGLSIRLGGKPVAELGSRKAEALLVYLAHSRRPQSREVLSDLLWDDRSTAQALTNLRWTLTKLGKQLAPYLVVTRTTIGLMPEGRYWLDVAEMEEGLARARARRTRGDSLSPAAAHDLEEALALYSGPFLQGFYLRDRSTFEDWALAEQDRLQRLAVATLRDLLIYSQERSEYVAGIAHAARLIQIEPLDEDAHRKLMQLLALSGQRQAALQQYETCRRVLASELGSAPGADTTRLYNEIQAGEYPAAGLEPRGRVELADAEPGVTRTQRARPQNLPHPLTPFVGRKVELDELGRYLADPECRLVTLVGPGGSGKTRLAIEAAQAIMGFPDGVYFVSLAQVSEPAFIVGAITEALGVSLAGTHDQKSQFFAHLRDKHLLLLLDNFEHLLEGAGLLAEMLEVALDVKVLVTSREPLDLSVEQVFDMAGLPVPSVGVAGGGGTVDGAYLTVGDNEAVRLFVQRARNRMARFDLSPEIAPWVARICRLVEGLPLGIELAAANVRGRTCEEIALGLEGGIDVLQTSHRDIPARHRSMRAVFDQSFGLLREFERKALRQVSVFRGGFDAEEAIHVAGTSRDELALLGQKTLIRQSPSGRYEMHELLRQYAWGKLDESPMEREETQARHASYYLELTAQSHTGLVGPLQVEWINRLEQEHDNLRAALRWALERGQAVTALGMCVWLQRFWYYRGYLAEARRWLESALALPSPADAIPEWERLRARALNAAGQMVREQGDNKGALALFEESAEILRRVDPTRVGSMLGNLGLCYRDSGDYVRAQALLEEAQAWYQEAGDTHGVGLQMNSLGKVALWAGDTTRARRLLESAIAILREVGEARVLGLALANLGRVANAQGQHEESVSVLRESLSLYASVGDKRGLTECLEGLAIALGALGLWGCVGQLYGAAGVLRAQTGTRLEDWDRAYLQRLESAAHDHLGVDAWEEACAAGRVMSQERAIECALT